MNWQLTLKKIVEKKEEKCLKKTTSTKKKQWTVNELKINQQMKNQNI